MRTRIPPRSSWYTRAVREAVRDWRESHED